ncbi:MAG: arylsulfatase [Opitutaceae bacterium]|nr:arylsulfatase [Opitutaceae bacterium]
MNPIAWRQTAFSRRLLIGLAAIAVAALPVAGLASPPNIIFILADDLGYGDLGVYGQEEIRTPNIDRLAAQGVRFTQFYAGSCVCAPSRNVLMTGQHSGKILLRGNVKLNLPAETVTVAEMLRAAGYTTGLAGKWGLGAENSAGAPTRQGFNFFFGYADQTHAHNYFPEYLIRGEERIALRNVVPSAGKQGQGVATIRRDYSADLIADAAVEFVTTNRDGPFFLYFASTHPHANNEAGERGMEVPDFGSYHDRPWPDAEKGYAAMVSRLDRDVGRILAKLIELGIDDRTIVFFSSDNGPHREGGHDPARFRSSGPLRGIKRDLYEGGVRVPMIVRWPGRIPAGTTSHHIGYFGDFFATAAELAGCRTPDGLDSISLVKALTQSPGQIARSHVYWESYERGVARAVRLGRWKAVQKPYPNGTLQLFDLSEDVAESRDVADSFPEVVAQIRRIMQVEHTSSPHFPKPNQR